MRLFENDPKRNEEYSRIDDELSRNERRAPMVGVIVFAVGALLAATFVYVAFMAIALYLMAMLDPANAAEKPDQCEDLSMAILEASSVTYAVTFHTSLEDAIVAVLSEPEESYDRLVRAHGALGLPKIIQPDSLAMYYMACQEE